MLCQLYLHIIWIYYEAHDKDMINLATFFCLQNSGTLPTICEEYTTIACFQLNYRFKSPPWICPKASNVGKSKKHHNLGTRSLSNNTSRNTWAACVYVHHVCLLCTTVHAILNVKLTQFKEKGCRQIFAAALMILGYACLIVMGIQKERWRKVEEWLH